VSASERLHGLDAVRGYALLLGVVFHATMSFLPGPQVWMVRDIHSSALLGAVFFVSHTFRMTTFFLIAGFFAHLMVERRGVRAFIKDRLKRIGIPLVVGWPVLFAAIIAASVYGIYVATGHVPAKPPPAPANPPPLAFPLTHLWFLYVLLLLYAFTLIARWFVRLTDRQGRVVALGDRLVRRVMEKRAAALLLALPAAAALYGYDGWLPWFGVPTPDNSLIPNPPAAVEFGLAFGFGWLLNRQPGLLQAWSRRWGVNLAAAIVLTSGLLAWLGFAPVIVPPKPGLERLGLAAGYALSMWCWTLAVIGLALRYLSDPSPVRRYIADSSYWIYLIHLPLIIALQAAVSRQDWPWEAKFAVVLGVGFPLMFATYHLLVRRTFIGAILNGRRAPRPVRTAPATIQLEPIP
jgi:peptidoglycan/LPS O-acetylase OafA/YrhL